MNSSNQLQLRSLNTIYKPKQKRSLAQSILGFFRGLWRLRYRVYAIIVLLAMLPILYASNLNIPNNIDAIGFNELNKNFLFTTISDQNNFYPQQVATLSDNTTSFFLTSEIEDQNIADILSRFQISANEQVELNKLAPLDTLIPAPKNPQQQNFLKYPKYNINTPIIYSGLDDLFNRKADGSIDFSSPIEEDLSQGPLSNPIQRLLVDGIVHIAFTPLPGEIGNSYIVGHSSNFSSVQSSYNFIFKPIERRSEVGEEFILWDKQGRELTFKVFEVKEILENDTQEAYKTFGDRRVVTLQTSILEFVPGQGLQPTKRWLTRGELIL